MHITLCYRDTHTYDVLSIRVPLSAPVICELRGGKCNAADDRPLLLLHTACTRHCGFAHGTMLNLQDSILGLDTVVNSESCTYIM